MINKDRLVNQFKTMVEFDSETYHERELADYLMVQLQELGFEVEEDDVGLKLKSQLPEYGDQSPTGNIFGRLKGNTGGNPILLSSHMDTVRPGIGKRAVEDEHGVITSEGETILGADDLSGIAAILEAVRVMKENNLPHPDIEVLFPVAEEFYGRGSDLFDYSKITAPMSYTFDLSGEIGSAAIAAPTIISFEIRIQGKNAHAGFCPERGVHAIAIGAHGISQLKQGWVDKVTTVNVGKISGGKQTNIVPDECIVMGEVRSLKDARAMEEVEKLREVFTKAAALYQGSMEFHYEKHVEAYEIGQEEEVVRRFCQVCKKVGLTPAPQITLGGSDNNHFVRNGIRGIVVACGMHKVHTTNEYTTIEDLEKASSLAVELITHQD